MKHIALFLLTVSTALAQLVGSVQNLTITCQSNTQVTATATYCDVRNVSATAGLANVSVTGDISTNGANGLDTSSVSPNSWYATFIISHADGSSPAMLFSLNVSPTSLPAGYALWRPVDWERTDGSAHLIKHLTTGRQHDWSWIVDSSNVSCAIVNASSHSNFSQIDASSVAPPTSQLLYGVLQTSNAASVYVRALGYGTGTSSPSTGMALLLAQTASYYAQVWIPMDSGQQFEILDGGHTTSLFASGFDTGL